MRIVKLDYHGIVYNLEVAGDESYIANGIVVHNCVQIPQTRMLPLEVESGSDLFARLTPAEQLKVLGPRKLALWRKGEFDLEDVVGRKHNALWGSMRFEQSAADTLARAASRSRPGTFQTVADAKSWVEQKLAGDVSFRAGDQWQTWGAAYKSEAGQLTKLNAISREWLSLQRRFPALSGKPLDELYITQSERGRGTLDGPRPKMAVADGLTAKQQQRIIDWEKATGRRWSMARPETWAEDNFRHELGHVLTTPQVRAGWEAVYTQYGKEWFVGNVSEYVGDPHINPVIESLAECFLEVTRIGYRHGALPQDIEQFIEGILR